MCQDLPITDEREIALGVERVESEREDNCERQRKRLQNHERVAVRDHHTDRVCLNYGLK